MNTYKHMSCMLSEEVAIFKEPLSKSRCNQLDAQKCKANLGKCTKHAHFTEEVNSSYSMDTFLLSASLNLHAVRLTVSSD